MNMASSGSPKKTRRQSEICVKEEFKIAVKIALDRFRFQEKQKVLEFPSSFTSLERAYIHRMCQNIGLASQSQGKGRNRYLTVSKKDVNTGNYSSILKLSSNACQHIEHLAKKFPLNIKERQELQPKTERSTATFDSGRSSRENKVVGKLNNNMPAIPPVAKPNEFSSIRKSLPIYELREQILKLISENQVILISGETGSGKTTQVPQFILEDANTQGTQCRIVCTQPRRISALSVSERVATERGERLGQTVGYQIRLDNRISPKTLLTYCTTGVLLQTLMSGDNSLSFVTHVIVDEIHERDRFTDFLLIAVRDLLAVNRRLKLILMSAALDIQLFIDYFGKCPVVNVPGRCFEVKEYFLEDVLKMTSYCSDEMARHLKDTSKAQIKTETECADSVMNRKSTSVKENLDEAKIAEKNNEAEKIEKTVELCSLDKVDLEPEELFDEELQPRGDIDLEEDSDSKIAGNAQGKDYLEAADFPLDEELTDGEVMEQDILLEDDDDNEGANEDVDDDEEDEEVVVEEENNDDDEIKEVEEGVEVLKLEDEVENGSAQTEEVNSEDKQDDEESYNEEQYLREEMDNSISEAWLNGSEDAFVQILYLVMQENISVDYQHSETQATPLMVASGRGCASVVEQLLNLGANPHIKEPKNGWTAIDWAKKWEHTKVVELLESSLSSPKVPYVDETALEKESEELNDEDRELLSVYHRTFDDDKIDRDLVISLVGYICTSSQEGAILVFLPGYDDIISLRDALTSHREFGNSKRYQIFMLHSSMQPSEQREVFRKLPHNTRKIVLSTNIAETSVTINDVVFVIDCGKVKEKSFDALTSVSSLHPVWVSKASAIQRRGRAGRCSPGICFHLFSRVRFENLLEYQIPELLRTPLQELCLHTKLLASPNTSIADFISKAPEPPPFLVLRNAVALLKTIDALDQWEDLTDLGRHLADLPLSPHLGKMVLYSVVLKCLDPVVTIACALAYRDPFVLPMYSAEKRAAAAARKKLILDPFSDHLVFVQVFRAWQRARSQGHDKSFCHRNYLSQATLEMMAGMRSQILGQLKVAGFIRPRGAGDIKDLNTNSNNFAVVKAALCAGTFPLLARVDRSRSKLTTQKENSARFHNSSIMNQPPSHGESMSSAQAKSIARLPSDWLIYEEMTRLYTTVTVKCCTLVSPVTVALFTGPSLSSEHVMDSLSSRDGDRYLGEGFIRESESSDSETDDGTGGEKNKDKGVSFKVDEWIALSGNQEIVKLVWYLRHKLQALVIRRIRSPSRPWSQVDEMVVRAVAAVLTAEEHVLNPSLYPRQRRTRPGIESAADLRTRKERSHLAVQFSPSREQLQELSGSLAKSERSVSPHHASKASGEGWTTPPTQQRDARYFIMKCNNQRNLDISMAKGIWATTLANEKKLNRAFKETKLVVLIFSVQGSGHFQGYAHMTSVIGKEKSPEFGSTSLSGVFSVEWIKKANIPFQQAHHLVNPWNDHKKVQISRDGQELEPKIGEELCKLWDADNSSQGGRTPRTNNSINRRGKPSVQSDPHPTPSQWQSSQPNLGYTAMQQVYTAHTPSLPIPVPIPSPRHTVPAHYPGHQVVTPQPMAVHTHPSVPFGAQAAVLQSQFHATAPRFTGALPQTPNARTMGPPPRGSRGPFNASRK
ncbi:3'-5' RNA helicase YTHDC2-like [Acropora millepora]|uniref:3'-5' RNA helicase YTHDC2-like n=1 Tax=Acropora millepora TaxID=45264 RepID=UPI001CF1D08B|nr:3'-5' RNA helicase YTHDC2-like [Acropora millepora]